MVREPELALYRTCTPVSATMYERDGGTLTEALVEAIAEAEGVPPSDLPPLYDSIDLDALAQVLDKPSDSEDDDLLLGLRMDCWNVFVSSDGQIRVCDATEETSPERIFADDSA